MHNANLTHLLNGEISALILLQPVQVVFEKNGVLEQICEGKGYIDMSTVDSATSLKINEVRTF